MSGSAVVDKGSAKIEGTRKARRAMASINVKRPSGTGAEREAGVGPPQHCEGGRSECPGLLGRLPESDALEPE